MLSLLIAQIGEQDLCLRRDIALLRGEGAHLNRTLRLVLPLQDLICTKDEALLSNRRFALTSA